MRADTEQRALTAFAAPITTHARGRAVLVLASILLDVQHGESQSVAAEAVRVDAGEEYASARAEVHQGETVRHYPTEAASWVKAVWCEAFAAELGMLVAKHAERKRAAGEDIVREHLRSLDRSRAS